MTFAFVFPDDPSVLDGRPLLDVGCGDGLTSKALGANGLVIGIDVQPQLLKGRLAACASATALPFVDAYFATVLAADLCHHLSDEDLGLFFEGARRVLRPSGSVVAWWISHPLRHAPDAPDAPRYPRSYELVAEIAVASGFTSVELLPLKSVAYSSQNVGMIATK